jgi:hypothetical protein
MVMKHQIFYLSFGTSEKGNYNEIGDKKIQATSYVDKYFLMWISFKVINILFEWFYRIFTK